ncbi:hypothetical protein M406DRAFT_233426, partial [Cryphonectria parasitica EP155]
MAPLKPDWPRPSHPEIQEVVFGEEGEFTSKSLSRVAVPPFGVFADMTFPPCVLIEKPSYASVQVDQDKHILLNSDLLYMNHSCDPSLILDTSSMQVLAGPKGLQPGDELTFFYPSTEWFMAQPFTCLCGSSRCRGTISGARDMTSSELEGYWLSGHIRSM